MRTGIIYRATNLINGKCYVGQTIQTLEKRIIAHYAKSKTINYKFSNSLRKYKKEDWKWEIILENVAFEHLNELEMFLIWYCL